MMICKENGHTHIVLKILGGIVAGVGFAFLFGLAIMLLWNELLPHLFDLPFITYWQAFGLAILGRLLFGGIGNGGSRSSRGRAKRPTHGTSERMKDWHYYDEWWNTEGERSFRDYAEKAKGKDVRTIEAEQ